MIINSIVVNAVLWDGSLETWVPPANTIMVQSNQGEIGWTYNDGILAPPLSIPITPMKSYAERLGELLVTKNLILQSELEGIEPAIINMVGLAEELTARGKQ